MKPFSIRQYVALLTFIPLFIMAISMEFYFLRHHFSQLDQGAVEKAELLAHQLASSCEYGVFSNNMIFLQNIANGALKQTDIHGVLILDANAGVLASAGQFSSAFKSEIIERNLAKRLQFARTGDIDDAIVLQPMTAGVQSLWLYHAIIPAQITLDDIGTQTDLKPTGSVIVEISRARQAKDKTQLLWVSLLATTLFLVVASYLSYVASRRITQPIRKLSEAVEAIGAGRLDTRVSRTTSVSELATLAQGMNKMAEHLEREQEILHQRIDEATLALREKKEEAERANQDKSRFLAVASHDLRQPLHALGLYVAELQRKLSGTAQHRLTEQIGHSVDALSMLLNTLLDISKLDAGTVVPQRRTFSVGAILKRITTDYQMLADVKNIRNTLQY